MLFRSPYEIIDYSFKHGINKISEGKALYRPWLQDFNLGAIYDGPMIRKQIQAVYDNDLDGWLLWNASNNYTRSGLKNN